MPRSGPDPGTPATAAVTAQAVGAVAPFLERLRPRGVRRGRAPLDQGRRWRRAGRGGPPPAAARLPGTRVGLRARRTQLWAASAHRPAPRLLGRLRRHGAGLCPGRRALPPGCSAQRPGRLPGPPPAPADPRHALPSPRRGRPHARCAALVGVRAPTAPGAWGGWHRAGAGRAAPATAPRSAPRGAGTAHGPSAWGSTTCTGRRCGRARPPS